MHIAIPSRETAVRGVSTAPGAGVHIIFFDGCGFDNIARHLNLEPGQEAHKPRTPFISAFTVTIPLLAANGKRSLRGSVD
jgi:hypothetical protein